MNFLNLLVYFESIEFIILMIIQLLLFVIIILINIELYTNNFRSDMQMYYPRQLGLVLTTRKRKPLTRKTKFFDQRPYPTLV